jgi:hypothetical protein
VILGAGEEQVAVPVVLEERERALVPLHENRPHLAAGCCSPPPPPGRRKEG